MATASLERLKNDVFSVMHSSISIPNENVSEPVVARTLLSSMSSGTKYLTAPLDTLSRSRASFQSHTFVGYPDQRVINLQSGSREDGDYLPRER